MTACSRRRTWFSQFRARLGQCSTQEEIETLLKGKLRRWHKLNDCAVPRSGTGGAIGEDVDIQAEGSPNDGLSNDYDALMLDM